MAFTLNAKRLQEDREQSRLLEKILIETPDRDHPSKIDRRRNYGEREVVRGIPIVGGTASGTMSGTSPHHELLKKEGKRDRLRERLDELSEGVE